MKMSTQYTQSYGAHEGGSKRQDHSTKCLQKKMEISNTSNLTVHLKTKKGIIPRRIDSKK